MPWLRSSRTLRAIVGVATDPVFGPVISFGAGGSTPTGVVIVLPESAAQTLGGSIVSQPQGTYVIYRGGTPSVNSGGTVTIAGGTTVASGALFEIDNGVGSAGADLIYGNANGDVLAGGAGNDTLTLNFTGTGTTALTQVADGGEGVNSISVSNSVNPNISYQLSGGSGADTIIFSNGIRWIRTP